MSQTQFADRLNRIAEKSGTDTESLGYRIPSIKPNNDNSGSNSTMIFGIIWGVILANVTIFANQNYEQLKELSAVLFMASIGFFLLSLLIFAVMIVAGIISFLLGRRSPKRWRFLLGVVAGVAGGSILASVLFS